jgi:aminopeptidase N
MKVIMLLLVVLSVIFCGQLISATDIYDSGGPLMPEQASYDVTYYDLSLYVNPMDSSISGSVRVEAKIVQPLDVFVLDLDTLLQVSSIQEITDNKSSELQYTHENGKIWIELKHTRQSNEFINVQVNYEGYPRIAPSPPWQGGFTWKFTEDGSPWIATSCQGEGADIWWPNKDHVSDKPDSMGIHIRVQEQLVVATNGRLESVESHDDQTQTYHWFVSTPISGYNVALNIAPYKVLSENYTSVSGDIIPVSFWVLPEDYEKGEAFFPEILEHLNFFERSLGPYPFRADKYGVAQTPHLGMEHQTIIAYGANFNNGAMTVGKDWGFDALHHHELSHEWWGNGVTCSDWRDMWIHEGFGTYMQALYLEETQGIEQYHAYLKSIRDFWNIEPVAPKISRSAEEISISSVYFKGAWILHTLRYLIGDEEMKLLLRRMIYTDPEMERVTDGKQVRFVSTNDFLNLAQSISGQDLDWFVDVYLRQSELPALVSRIENGYLKIQWDAPDNLPFPMPVDIRLGDKTERFEIPSEGRVIGIEGSIEPIIDPDNWLLYQHPLPDEIFIDSSDLENYVGRYETEFRNRKRKIEISREGQSLYLKSGRFPMIELFASSKTEFFTKVSDKVRIKFNFDEMGIIESVTYNIFPREITYMKSDNGTN